MRSAARPRSSAVRRAHRPDAGDADGREHDHEHCPALEGVLPSVRRKPGYCWFRDGHCDRYRPRALTSERTARIGDSLGGHADRDDRRWARAATRAARCAGRVVRWHDGREDRRLARPVGLRRRERRATPIRPRCGASKGGTSRGTQRACSPSMRPTATRGSIDRYPREIREQ